MEVSGATKKIYHVMHFTDTGHVPPLIPGPYDSGPLVDDTVNWNRYFNNLYGKFGFGQLNVIFNADKTHTLTINGATTSLSGLLCYFNTGELINVHWNEQITYDMTEPEESGRFGLPIQTISTGYNPTQGTYWNVITVNTTDGTGDNLIAGTVTLSTGLGRAYDRQRLNSYQDNLLNYNKFPTGCLIMFNREGHPWLAHSLIQTSGWEPVDLLDSFVDTIQFMKGIRPDCSFGYYGILPKSQDLYYSHVNEITGINSAYYSGLFNAQFEYSRPLAEAVDFLMPYIYPPSPTGYWANHNLGVDNDYLYHYPYPRMISGSVNYVLSTMQNMFSGKPVIPLFWYQNYGEWANLGATAIDTAAYGATGWTPARVIQILESGYVWSGLLNVCTNNNVNNIAIWGQGYMGWSGDYPWWLATSGWMIQSVPSLTWTKSVSTKVANQVLTILTNDTVFDTITLDKDLESYGPINVPNDRSITFSLVAHKDVPSGLIPMFGSFDSAPATLDYES